ncbi:hypothetical protein [Streptomyces lushanensis]|uniref:hypothetical protein n=1 Tax=Streptomyces lushanensis TaxID=1434255 RepID=UPI000832E26C|nr:hypothetical protein [Streptomyces lushanensis]
MGATLNAAEDEAPNSTTEEYLHADNWPEVVGVAGRLAHVMVTNDLSKLVALHEAGRGGTSPLTG